MPFKETTTWCTHHSPYTAHLDSSCCISHESSFAQPFPAVVVPAGVQESQCRSMINFFCSVYPIFIIQDNETVCMWLFTLLELHGVNICFHSTNTTFFSTPSNNKFSLILNAYANKSGCSLDWCLGKRMC